MSTRRVLLRIVFREHSSHLTTDRCRSSHLTRISPSTSALHTWCAALWRHRSQPLELRIRHTRNHASWPVFVCALRTLHRVLPPLRPVLHRPLNSILTALWRSLAHELRIVVQICIGSVVHTACHYRNLWILANTPHFEGCGGVLREKDVPYDFGEYFRLMFVARCATARATLYVASRVASAAVLHQLAAVLHQLLCCNSCCVASAAGFSATVCLPFTLQLGVDGARHAAVPAADRAHGHPEGRSFGRYSGHSAGRAGLQ